MKCVPHELMIRIPYKEGTSSHRRTTGKISTDPTHHDSMTTMVMVVLVVVVFLTEAVIYVRKKMYKCHQHMIKSQTWVYLLVGL